MIKTVSLDTARKLKDAGFKQDNSYFACLPDAVDCERIWPWEDLKRLKYLEGRELLSLPNTDELLEELPSTVYKTPIGSIGICYLEIMKWDDGYYYASYKNPKIHTSSCGLVGYRDKSPCEALALLWLWLKSEGIVE